MVLFGCLRKIGCPQAKMVLWEKGLHLLRGRFETVSLLLQRFEQESLGLEEACRKLELSCG